MGYEAVEHIPARFVAVQAVVQEGAQEPPALRHAEGVGAFQVAIGIETQVRRYVAGSRQPQPGYGCAGGGVDDLVHLARLESSFQVHVARIGYAPPVFQAGEPPLTARYDLLRGVFIILDGHHRLPVLQVVGRVGPVHPVGQVLRLDHGVGLEGHNNLARHGFAAFQRFRRVDSQQPRRVGDVVLPAAPHHGVALPHQEPVARVQGRVGRNVRCAVDVAQGKGFAPVQHVQQQPPVAFAWIVRAEDAKVRAELDLALGIARGQLDIGDGLVGRMERVNGKVSCPVYLRVRACGAEGLSIGKGTLRSDFKPGDWHSFLLDRMSNHRYTEVHRYFYSLSLCVLCALCG